ncbi:MAG TPA: GntR family transcriptional regulator [Polyangiaceae bacterium]|nr:GntR family transcriptional regulator [Polyangiaceae bacterium]
MSDTPRTSNIADTIFAALRQQILSGGLKVGERLPGERELAAKYDTNRNTLREAVRKLEQARLVTVKHGRGLTVADFRKTGTLELLAPYLQTGPDISDLAQVVEDILPPRILLIEHAARLAARRADQADVDRLRQISELLIRAFESNDPALVARGFQSWLDALVDAGHSMAIRWIANPFFDALRETLTRFPMLWVMEPTFPKHLRDFVSAVADGDEERAATLTRTYYTRVDSILMKLLRAGVATSRSQKASRSQEP